MIFARVANGTVQEVYCRPDIHAGFAIDQLFHPAVLGSMLDVTSYDPVPQQGWITRDHGKTFQPPPAS